MLQEHIFSHIGQEHAFQWLSEMCLFWPACLVVGWNCCLKLSIIAHVYRTSGTTLQHLICGCNCIYQHFVETKRCSVLENLLYTLLRQKRIWTTSDWYPHTWSQFFTGSILNGTCNIKYWPPWNTDTRVSIQCWKVTPGQYLTLKSYPHFTPHVYLSKFKISIWTYCTAVYHARLTHIMTLI